MNDESRAASKQLIADIINRIADDPEFKNGLLSDAKSTLESAGYAQRAAQLAEASEADLEVAGFAMGSHDPLGRSGSQPGAIGTVQKTVGCTVILGAVTQTSWESCQLGSLA